jgi:hypothetical protein
MPPRSKPLVSAEYMQTLDSILMADARRAVGLRDQEIPPVAPRASRPEHNLETSRRAEASRLAAASHVDLESLWGEEYHEAGPHDDGLNIEFDTEPMDANLPRPENPGAGRFRVDRGAPPRRPFQAEVQAGPQGGPMHETGSVRGYTVMREFSTPSPAASFSSSDPRYVGGQQVALKRGTPAKAEKPIYRPTIYEHLCSDVFDDD